MTGRTERRFAVALLAACALAIAGCGGGGSSTGAGAGTVATDAPTKALRASNPFATLGKCESLYERVYASTARKIKELDAVGSEATPQQRRELQAAQAKHGRALEFCEEEIEINQVRGRQVVDIAATCTQSKAAVDKLRGELSADRRREFDQRRPVVCARVEG